MARRARSTWKTEWVAEPCEADGDIIDPLFAETEHQARSYVDFTDPAVAYVDIAKLSRYGNNDEGELDRVYEYVERIHRDGRREMLDTVDGLEPVVIPDMATLTDAELNAALSGSRKLSYWARIELDARAARARTTIPPYIGNLDNATRRRFR